MKNYAIQQAEASSDGNNIQNTYSNTYGNTRFDEPDNNLGKMDNIFGEVTRRRKRRNIVEPWSDSGDLDEKIRTMLYPGEKRHIDLLSISVHNNDPAHCWHSGFSQTHKIGNIGIIANFVFP